MSSGTSLASAFRTSAICSSLRVVPSSEITFSSSAWCSTSSVESTTVEVSPSAPSSSRPIEKVTPGGIEAVIPISEMR